MSILTKALATTATLAATIAMTPAAGATTASATSATNPTVGALFANTTTAVHGCTASVVNSTSGDLILTAAHCVHGNGAGMRFTPGYQYGSAPYGSWTTTAAYVPSTWKAWRNPAADVAVLRVDHPIQNVVGANTLATIAPKTGQNVTVPAYATGSGDHQLTCTAPVYYNGTYPAFNCGGYPGGVSGSPWITNGYIYGVIGGLHQGGCYPTTSYSANLAAYGGVGPYLVTRAENGSAPDTGIPSAGSDGC